MAVEHRTDDKIPGLLSFDLNFSASVGANGGQGGVVYTINQKWGRRVELGPARGIGVLVSSTIIKILLGTTYNIGN